MDSKKEDIEVSIVVPVYNEGEHITLVLDEIVNVMEQLGRSFEVIAVDDGSKDNSFEILKEYHKKDSRISVVRLTRNFGQHPAVYAGFTYARGKILLSMDGDGQNPPEEIPNLIKVLEEGNFDFVQGWRTERQDSFFRKFFSKFVNKIITKITGTNLKDIGCGMAVYNRNTVNQLLSATHYARYIPTEICWMGLKTQSLPIKHRKREKGRSRYRIWSLFWVNFDIITSISTIPVEIIGFVGILLSFLSLPLWFFLSFYFLFEQNYKILNFIILSFLILEAIQLLCISIICIYISRVYREVQDRPYFIIKESLVDDKIHNTMG